MRSLEHMHRPLLMAALGFAALVLIGPATAVAQSPGECYLEAGNNQGESVILRLRPGLEAVNVESMCQALSDSARSPWSLVTDLPRSPDGSVTDPARTGLDLACEGNSHGATYTIWNTPNSAADVALILCADPWWTISGGAIHSGF
jgi:hypothetical protein